MPEPMTRRSRIDTQAVQRAPNRAMPRAAGFSDADFDKPTAHGVLNRSSQLAISALKGAVIG